MLPHHEMFVPLILRHTNEPPGVSLKFIWLTTKLRASAHRIRQDSILRQCEDARFNPYRTNVENRVSS